MTFPLNLTLTCYCHVMYTALGCYVNKDGGGVNDLSCKPNFDLLLSRGVNSPRLCYINKRWRRGE